MRELALNPRRAYWRAWALVVAGVLSSGCDDEPKPKPAEPPKEANPAPVVSASPKRDVAPTFEIDTLSPKVGFERALLQHPEGAAQLAELVGRAKRFIDGKEVVLVVDRQAKVPWVAAYLEELGRASAKAVTIRTSTRKEYSQDQSFVPESKANAPACSVVGMVTSDYATAVWKLSGGTAGKRSKGMAGPDLSMTGDTIERFAKGCKDSRFFFVSVAEGIEWGLAFDLGASSRVLEHAKFDTTVLLNEVPTPGRKVELKH